MNNKILNEVDKIVDYIKETEEYHDYLFLKEKLSKHERANELIKNIKIMQQKLVKLEVAKADTKELELKIEEAVNELNRIPLYVEFIEKQENLNDMYQSIKNRLDDYFYSKLN